MAGEILATFNAGDLFRETPVGYQVPFQSVLYQTNNGATRGVSLNKFLTAGGLVDYYNGIWYVPAAVALATGLTFKFIVSDDGTDASDLGKVIRLGVTPYNLSTALSVMDFSLAAAKGTETFVNITLGATTGLPVTGSVAIVNANLASLAVTNTFGMRVRRVGDNAADTANNRVILYGGAVTNT